jgi:hypothetical protein
MKLRYAIAAGLISASAVAVAGLVSPVCTCSTSFVPE